MHKKPLWYALWVKLSFNKNSRAATCRPQRLTQNVGKGLALSDVGDDAYIVPKFSPHPSGYAAHLPLIGEGLYGQKLS